MELGGLSLPTSHTRASSPCFRNSLLGGGTLLDLSSRAGSQPWVASSGHTSWPSQCLLLASGLLGNWEPLRPVFCLLIRVLLSRSLSLNPFRNHLL